MDILYFVQYMQWSCAGCCKRVIHCARIFRAQLASGLSGRPFPNTMVVRTPNPRQTHTHEWKGKQWKGEEGRGAGGGQPSARSTPHRDLSVHRVGSKLKSIHLCCGRWLCSRWRCLSLSCLCTLDRLLTRVLLKSLCWVVLCPPCVKLCHVQFHCRHWHVVQLHLRENQKDVTST